MLKKNILRYTNLGNAITVELETGYLITAFISWKKLEEKYYITLYINEKTTPTMILISDAENIEFKNDENIKMVVTKYIYDLNSENFFARYINEYEHMLKCYNRGFEEYELEHEEIGSENK